MLINFHILQGDVAMNKDFKFEDLYEAIYKILPNEDLQELMDVCYDITGVPILIVDIMYNVYGIAPLHPVGNENRDYLLEHRTYDDERVHSCTMMVFTVQ